MTLKLLLLGSSCCRRRRCCCFLSSSRKTLINYYSHFTNNRVLCLFSIFQYLWIHALMPREEINFPITEIDNQRPLSFTFSTTLKYYVCYFAHSSRAQLEWDTVVVTTLFFECQNQISAEISSHVCNVNWNIHVLPCELSPCVLVYLLNAWITTDYRWTLEPVRIFKIVWLQLLDVNVSLTINSSGYPKRRDTNIQFPQPKKSTRSNNRVRCQIPSTPNIAADWLFIDIVCYSNESSSRKPDTVRW